MITAQNVTGVILAGGRGSRLGGMDKGWALYQGRPMIEHVIAAFRPQVADLIINANRHVERYADYGYPVVTDDSMDYRGPLAGVAAGLQVAETDFIATLPCDNPQPPRDLVARMLRALNSAGAQVCTISLAGQWQPTYLLVHRCLRGELLEYLASGQRAVRDWLTMQQPVVVELDMMAVSFLNLNTPADFVQHEEGVYGG